MSLEKLRAHCDCAKIISAYNHLRHFVIGRIDKIEENVVNLDTDRNRSSFLISLGIDSHEYINDLNEKAALIKKGDYDKSELKKYLEEKIIEVDYLSYLS